MLRALIIVVIAGSCHAQSQGAFSECADELSIVTSCSDTHLSYLAELNPSQVELMQRVSQIDDPSFLLDQLNLNDLCTEKVHLKQYYLCVHANLTWCLRQVNSSQAKNLPDALAISQGIGHFCDNRNEVNKTCFGEKADDVKLCFGTFISESDRAGDQCATYEALIGCTEKAGMCPGSKVVKDFVASARPNGCMTLSASAAVPLPCAPARALLLVWAVVLGYLDLHGELV